MKKRRAGFSFVELLIALAIMAALASAMLLTLGGGTDKAEATRIASDLQSIRAAALLYVSDKAGTDDAGKVPTLAALEPYLHGGTKLTQVNGAYKLFPSAGTASDKWFIGYSGITPSSGVAQKLALQAAALDLLGGDGSSEPTAQFQASEATVWLRIR